MVAALDGLIFPEDGVHYDELIAASDDDNDQERRVTVWGGPVQFEGILSLPVGAHTLVVIAYDRMGSSEHLLGDLNDLAEVSRRAGLATLLVNLLTLEDEALDKTTGFFRENVNVLHQRMKGIANWLIATDEKQSLDLGYFGVGVSAAAALRPDAIHAIVAPRIDLVSPCLPRVVTPTLLMVAERDTQGLDMSRRALAELTSDTTLDVVRETRERGLPHTLEAIPSVANVFEKEQSQHQVEQLATWWFTSHLSV